MTQKNKPDEKKEEEIGMFVVSALALKYLKMHHILCKINSCRNHSNYALFNGNPTLISHPDISASRKKTCE